MRNLLGSALRGSLYLAAAGCLAAVGIGRMCGPAPHVRCIEQVKFVNFPIAQGAFSETEPRILDVELGVESHLDVPEGDALDLIAVSPWHDDRGHGQVAGRWSSRSGKECGLLLHEFGLARYTFPEGKPLNRVPLDVTPTGRLCWLPGTEAKVLFTAGDGTLYRFAFEGSTESDGTRGGFDSRPHPILWKVAPPGEGEGHFHMADPCRPEGCGFGGRLLVSMSYQVRDRQAVRDTPPQLWWLQLDRDSTSIEAAGPFTIDPSGDPSKVRERNPTLVRTPSGEVLAAYLERRSDREPWRAVVAKVESGNRADRPLWIDRTRAKVVVEDCDPSNLAYSPDGRWLYYLPGKGASRLIRRVQVPSLDDGRDDTNALVAIVRPGF